jgi:predicted amidohydrolase YtcJ
MEELARTDDPARHYAMGGFVTPAFISLELDQNDSRNTSTSSSVRRAGSVLLGLGALLVSAVASAHTPPTPPAAPLTPSRTIFYNGKVFTPGSPASFGQAVAVKDSTIEAVGSNQSMFGYIHSNTKFIDLHGRAVVPGLNDAHVHVLTPPGTYLNGPDFVEPPDPTLPEVLSLIQAGAAANPPGTWLIVLVGPDIATNAGVNRAALDTVSPDHPVKLEVWTGHGTYINTKAMQTLGIGEQEPDPAGGRYERYAGTSTLTGEAHEYAEHQIRRKQYAAMTDAEAVGRYQAFAAQALVFGFTSLQDMAIGMLHERGISILKQANLPVRVRSMCIPLTTSENCSFSRVGLETFPRITTGGLKWITDGTPIERFAFLTEPYADKPDTMGEFNFSDTTLETMLFRGLSGTQFTGQTLFHAVGDGAIEHVLDGLEATGGHSAWSGRRPRIEHGDLLFPENFPRMLDLGAVIVQNPTHLALTQIFAARLEPEMFGMIEPLRSLLDQGIPLAFGTDAIGRVGSPWVDVYLAAVHPTRPSQSITVAEAVRAYTAGSAYAEFEEGGKGSIAVGKKADLAVLSQDVFDPNNFGALPNTHSVLTMVDGKIAWQEPGQAF